MKLRKILNEAIDNAAEKAFYDAAKNNLIDIENFAKAFKSEIPSNLWDQIFDSSTGLLRNRKTYGLIKEAELPYKVDKALKKFWAIQYTTVKFDTVANVNKAADEKARDKQQIEAGLALAKEAVKLVDKTLYAKLVTELKQTVDVDVLDELKIKYTTTYKPLSNYAYIRWGVDSWSSNVTKYKGSLDLKPVETRTAQELADEINNKIKTLYDNLTKDINYRECKWWSKELVKLCEEKLEGLFVFQLPDDEGIEVISGITWEKVIKCKLPKDAILAGVKHIYKQQKHNQHSTTENSYHYTYYSISNEANEMTIEELGVLLDPSKFVDNSYWGSANYKELTLDDVKNNSNYFKSGMDRWFRLESITYGTD